MTPATELVFVSTGGPVTAETVAAREWLGGVEEFNTRLVTVDELPAALATRADSVWCHWDDAPGELPAASRAALDAHARNGGGLLATLAAATLPARLGWEEVAPDEMTRAAWSPEPDDELGEQFSVPPTMRGLQSFRGHPLFDGLGSGAYTWAPVDDEPFTRCAYTGTSWPRSARVIAVQKAFIAMNADRRLAWEQMIGDGWVVCIGAYVNFAARDGRYRPELERLMINALRRVRRNGGQVRLLGGDWRPPRTGLELDPAVPLPPPASDLELPITGGGALSRRATDAPYTLAGDRALVFGRETHGHEEIWFHPFRAASRWSLDFDERVASRTAAPSGVGEGQVASHVSVAPGVLERRLELASGQLTERTRVASEAAAVAVDLHPTGIGPMRLVWTLETDLRLMWPYPANASGLLTYAVEGGALGVRTATGEWLGVRIEPAPAVLNVSNRSDADRSRVLLRAELELGPEPIRIRLLGRARDDPSTAAVFAGVGQQSAGERKPAVADSAVGEVGPVLESGDAELDAALRWARVRLRSYRAYVPGLGAALVAGYGRSRSGAFSDGRPGYAWFFGRDGCWTALASLCTGQFQLVRETLEFLGRHQGISGKIFHECTTSGVVHYDAADSTPLYLLLAARYLAWTGDLETLEREWERIERAYRFCLSTDSDGDGLIENTGVGHGWVEFGGLGGHHVSLYLAGVWTAALAELERAARALERRELADELAARAAAARSSLELSFYEPLERRYANGRRADGSLDMADTIMTAVPLALGVVLPERCEGWLDRVAGDEFTAGWGVRLVPRSHPGYRADGYHAGAVWPLFTGWVSLAECRAGRGESAYRHWESTARLHRRHALGAWPEVLHGDEPRSIGVTPDQAWSTAMAVLPLVEGLLGVRPWAPDGKVEMEPQIPAAWNVGALHDLRVGTSVLSIEWERAEGGIATRVRTEGEPIAVKVRDTF